MLGVAASSLIVQNGLVYFLDKWVTGPRKEEVIARVRNRVTAIFELEGETQREVVRAYEGAVRGTFVFAAVVAAVAVVITVGIRLPTLGGRKKVEREGEEEERE